MEGGRERRQRERERERGAGSPHLCHQLPNIFVSFLICPPLVEKRGQRDNVVSCTGEEEEEEEDGKGTRMK